MIRRPPRWLLACAGAAIAAAGFAVLPRVPSDGADEPVYALYYRFDIPLTAPVITLTDAGTRRNYAGTLGGTLGGLPLTSGPYTYGTGASARAGGGTFTLVTKAGAVKDGQILMTRDGKQTTLLFLGSYLGARLSFSLVGNGDQIGGTGVVTTGLAETSFQAHEQYVAAVHQATASLPPAARNEIVGGADQNLRLVREYQQKNPTH